MLFQAVRELLFNVVKHAGTLHADITMEQVDNLIRITVSDQGTGFDAESALNDAKAAHGLLSARQRLSLLGCNLQVFSKLGAGTRVVIDCPLLRPSK
jgi:signal transduction histidine kinase